jgi:hypothetical protein
MDFPGDAIDPPSHGVSPGHDPLTGGVDPYAAGSDIPVPRPRSRFSLRQPPARLLAMMCLNIAVRAGALSVSPRATATVRAVWFSWPPVMMPSGSGTMAPS